MHANNEIGVLQPIKEIGDLCKKYNSIFHTDVAQSIGTQKIDVEEIISMLYQYQLIKYTAQKE